MTNEEINIAIAKACGWKFIIEYCHGEDQPPELTTIDPNGKHLCGYYPDYVNDLNAMHEAEKVLRGKKDWSYCIYDENLGHVINSWKWNATAHQRAEAFLRTLNLWTE